MKPDHVNMDMDMDMDTDHDVSMVEQAGVGLSLILYGFAVAEFVGSIDLFPVHLYILALLIVTILLWGYRRQKS